MLQRHAPGEGNSKVQLATSGNWTQVASLPAKVERPYSIQMLITSHHLITEVFHKYPQIRNQFYEL